MGVHRMKTPEDDIIIKHLNMLIIELYINKHI